MNSRTPRTVQIGPVSPSSKTTRDKSRPSANRPVPRTPDWDLPEELKQCNMYKKIFTHNSCIDKANIRRGKYSVRRSIYQRGRVRLMKILRFGRISRSFRLWQHNADRCWYYFGSLPRRVSSFTLISLPDWSSNHICRSKNNIGRKPLKVITFVYFSYIKLRGVR